MPRLVLDFPDPPGPAVFTRPIEVITATATDQVLPALERVRDATTNGGLHAAGYIAYEAAPAFDPAMRVRPGGRLPLLWFGLFEDPEPGPEPDRPRPRNTGDAGPGAEAAAAAPEPDWMMETDRASHAAAVVSIHEAIAEGRTYQVNMTTRMRAPFGGDPRALYERMRRAQGAGYHAYLDLGQHVILSASPELFFSTHGRRIVTRPMKGTRPRGRWPDEDRALADELRGSEKDRAESLMITDLLRNDLGRVCDPGTIRVPALHRVERYRTVWQMTSTVEGRLRGDVRLPDLLAALFPCGSVTGAPKISTMAEIARLEISPREIYCGAIGWVRPGGDATFNVPIRTAWLDRDTASIEYGTGGGVVWDSTPGGEYEELRAKAVVIREAWSDFALVETLGLHDGRYARLERHLHRIRESAAYFAFPDPGPAVRRALDALAQRHSDGHHLARVAFRPDGTVEATAKPLLPGAAGGPGPVPEPGEPRGVVLAPSPVNSGDRFLFHKTTHRTVYERARRDAPAEAFDVLLHNERGELTEFTRGNLVVELNGRLLTPPRSAGLLAGCLRQELLENGTIAEATVTPDDLRRASRVWFINSARGWIEVAEGATSAPRYPGR